MRVVGLPIIFSMADDACCCEGEEGEWAVVNFFDHILSKRVSLRLGINTNLLSPAELCARIKLPLELVKAADWFFAQRSQIGVYKRPRQEIPTPFGYMFAEYSPILLSRLMFGCVATTCWRLASAHAKTRIFDRTTRRCAMFIMDRVSQGRASKVQVGCLRRWPCRAVM